MTFMQTALTDPTPPWDAQCDHLFASFLNLARKAEKHGSEEGLWVARSVLKIAARFVTDMGREDLAPMCLAPSFGVTGEA